MSTISSHQNSKSRVIVYVDGFNLYYGLHAKSQWKKYYWLDFVKLFEQFISSNQELIAVKYFSALVSNVEKKDRQKKLLSANQENPRFQLTLGKYLKKKIKCPNCLTRFKTYEEKETDVRLATQIVSDALQHNCDIAIIVSADSDMIPAVEIAKQAGIIVVIFFPPHHLSSDLASQSSVPPVNLSHYEDRFKKALLPDVVHISRTNYDLQIPEKWNEYKHNISVSKDEVDLKIEDGESV